MKRLIMKAPEGLSFEALTEEQQVAITKVFAQYTMPMPSTRAYKGKIIIDAVVADNFDPAAIGQLNLPFELIAMWTWDTVGDLVEVIALTNDFINYLADDTSLNDSGNVVLSRPTALSIPASWQGWPIIGGTVITRN